MLLSFKWFTYVMYFGPILVNDMQPPPPQKWPLFINFIFMKIFGIGIKRFPDKKLYFQFLHKKLRVSKNVFFSKFQTIFFCKMNKKFRKYLDIKNTFVKNKSIFNFSKKKRASRKGNYFKSVKIHSFPNLQFFRIGGP